MFNCVARMGWMNDATQWKDKTAGKNAEAESLGLFAYPSLMAPTSCSTRRRTCQSATTRSSISS